jgi:hypothetical protein
MSRPRWKLLAVQLATSLWLLVSRWWADPGENGLRSSLLPHCGYWLPGDEPTPVKIACGPVCYLIVVTGFPVMSRPRWKLLAVQCATSLWLLASRWWANPSENCSWSSVLPHCGYRFPAGDEPTPVTIACGPVCYLIVVTGFPVMSRPRWKLLAVQSAILLWLRVSRWWADPSENGLWSSVLPHCGYWHAVVRVHVDLVEIATKSYARSKIAATQICIMHCQYILRQTGAYAQGL